MSLGPAVPPAPKPPEPEWKPVAGRPHLFVNAKGQFRYAPPAPAAWPFWAP